MAGLTKAHQVICTMCTASCERDNVVNLLDRCCSALFKALLTQRVHLHIAVTNSFPRSAVLLVDIKCSCESVVLLCNQPLMFLTIPPVCKFWTVWICTTLLSICFSNISYSVSMMCRVHQGRLQNFYISYFLSLRKVYTYTLIHLVISLIYSKKSSSISSSVQIRKPLK